jgi:hypothetical protein
MVDSLQILRVLDTGISTEVDSKIYPINRPNTILPRGYTIIGEKYRV